MNEFTRLATPGHRSPAAVALIVGMGLAAWLLLPGQGSDPSARRPQTTTAEDALWGARVPPPAEPCLGAVKFTSAETMQQAVRVPMWLPEDRTPTGFWSCGSSPVVAYGDLQIEFDANWAGVDAPAMWKRMTANTTESDEVRSIQGIPAYVFSRESEDTFSTVEFVVDGVLVRLQSKPSVTSDELVAIASELKLPERS